MWWTITSKVSCRYETDSFTLPQIRPALGLRWCPPLGSEINWMKIIIMVRMFVTFQLVDVDIRLLLVPVQRVEESVDQVRVRNFIR